MITSCYLKMLKVIEDFIFIFDLDMISIVVLGRLLLPYHSCFSSEC